MIFMKSKMKKYEYLVLFVANKNNKEFKSILSNYFYTYNYLFKSFKNVYIVDINNLRFFHKKNNLDLKIVKNYFPNLNIKFLNYKKARCSNFSRLGMYIPRFEIIIICSSLSFPKILDTVSREDPIIFAKLA